MNTTARPRILNYSFQAFDPPGSVNTFALATNNRGQIVGYFTDAAGTTHGFLRQPDGSLVTLDAPSSVATFAGGINDRGTVVGQWLAVGGAAHGFTRSPSGIYTTLDFPGATDSGVEGLNDAGRLVGFYDMGDQTTTIGFLDVSGLFTSFEDPAAAPMQTLPAGINSPNFISGVYADIAGNEHGFVRDTNAQFHNFDFPGADFTVATRINDLGQVVGQYATNFPGHGFILSGAMTLTGAPSSFQFFSFDYPDSQNSALRGINNRGQVSGFFRLLGDPARHGFLATPLANDEGNQSNQ